MPDQDKETMPKGLTIHETSNADRFADCKSKVIDLLARLTTISVETMTIVAAMTSAAC
jgi:predicted helicase